MSQTKCLSLFAGVAASLGAASVTLADSQSWTESGLSTDEVRAIVSEMLSDADNRSSLLQSGSAGHDGSNFFLAGNGFMLTVGGQIQFRYVANFGDDDSTFRSDSFEPGFQTRRTKLEFAGHTDEFGFFVQGDFGFAGGGFVLQDAWVSHDIDNGWEVRWGQFKAPFLREELVNSKHQLAADRSFANEIFNQGRSQGIEINFEDDDWRFAAAFTDGFTSANSDFPANKGVVFVFDGVGDVIGGALSGGESDYAFTARGEWKWAGNWSDFDDFTAAPDQEYSGLIGAAFHWEGGDAASVDFLGAPIMVDYNMYSWTVDVSAEGNGWNAFAAYMGSTFDADDFDVTDHGFVVQGGFLIPDSDWEIFARWDAIIPDGDRAGDDTFNTLTCGANYYISGHAAKFTCDVAWHLDEGTSTDLVGSNTGIGYLLEDEDGQVVVRGQFQLLF